MGSLFSALSLKEDVVGLNIEDGIAAAAISSVDSRGRLHLKKVGWTEYNPNGSSENIADAISRMWGKESLGCFSVVSCLHSRALTLKRFQYPGLSESELEAALQLEAEEILQAAPESVVMDWRTNGLKNGTYDSAGSATDGTLVAVPRVDLDIHISMLQRAGLYPVATDVSCFAIANLFGRAGGGELGAGGGEHRTGSEAKEDVVCLARLGVKNADIAVLYGGGSIYPRNVFVHASQAQDSAKYFADSINDVVSYYRFKLHLPDIDKLCLTGVVDSDILERISKVVDLPVELWDPLSDVYGMSRSMSRRLDDAGLPVRAGLSVAMGLGGER